MCVHVYTHVLYLSPAVSCASYSLDQEGGDPPLSSHQSETKVQEESGERQMEKQREGLAGLRLVVSRGAATKPDVQVASLSSFLEDRLQSRQGCIRVDGALWRLAWFLLDGACLAEGSWDGVVSGPQGKGLLWKGGGLGSVGGGLLMREVRVGAATPLVGCGLEGSTEAFSRGGRAVVWSFKWDQVLG